MVHNLYRISTVRTHMIGLAALSYEYLGVGNIDKNLNDEHESIPFMPL